MIVALAILVVVGLGLCFELLAILCASAPRSASSIRIGAQEPAGDADAVIPRVIWTYWDTLPPPEFVGRCIALWRRFAADHEIRIVDRASASRWLSDDIDRLAFEKLPAYRQADWLRLQLLIRHGGIWMDGSTLLTQGLDWVHLLRAEARADVVGFYIDRYTTDIDHPIVENWFIAAAPGNGFLKAWARELDLALKDGEVAYLEKLRSEGRLEALAQGIPEEMRPYLAMHVACSVVLARPAIDGRLVLQRAEDVAFAFHAALRWRKRHLFARLALTPAPRRPPALIKLRSGDRAVIERNLARGWLWRRSLMGRLLEAASAA